MAVNGERIVLSGKRKVKVKDMPFEEEDEEFDLGSCGLALMEGDILTVGDTNLRLNYTKVTDKVREVVASEDSGDEQVVSISLLLQLSFSLGSFSDICSADQGLRPQPGSHRGQRPLPRHRPSRSDPGLRLERCQRKPGKAR